LASTLNKPSKRSARSGSNKGRFTSATRDLERTLRVDLMNLSLHYYTA
jgi:hypothetical protein